MNDAELIEGAMEFRNGILGSNKSSYGMCFAISAPLASFLDICCGVECSLQMTDHSENDNSEWQSHYWIKLKDGRVLDPTFDQLVPGADPIYLGEMTEFHL